MEPTEKGEITTNDVALFPKYDTSKDVTCISLGKWGQEYTSNLGVSAVCIEY